MHKILLIDDELTHIQTIARHLEEVKDRYEFALTVNSELAIKITLEKTPDLIIMDWGMPQVNGKALISYFKNQITTQNLPIIILTEADLSTEELERALRAGAMDYLRKPVVKTELLARINAGIKLSKLYQTIQKGEKALSNQRTKLEEMTQAQNHLMSIVAHDLKAPLNKVLGLVQLMPMVGELNHEQQSYVQMINKVVEGGRKLIDDILIINSYESSFETISPEKINMVDFLQEILKTFEQTANTKNIQLHLATPEEPVEIEGEADSLSRIFDNLLSNALKFTYRDKSIYINIESINQIGIVISIKDEGQGISAEDQKKMFRKFQKLSARPTGGESSTGLGLSIIKVLVEKLGGKIDFESAVGKGTTFYVHLPFKYPVNQRIAN
jgi:signal transduction histidine kinase